MAERNSEYERVAADEYVTPRWVVDALLDVEPFHNPIWECAPSTIYARSPLIEALTERGHEVVMVAGDFLTMAAPTFHSIITNPPYKLADKFILKALNLCFESKGKVAMLLPISFDSAHGRRGLFANCTAFKTKYVLTKRIRWENLEQKENGPSQNHAWFLWDWKHSGPATLGYLP